MIGIWVLPWQKRKNPLLGDKKHFFTEITQLHTLISAIDFQFLQCNRQNKLQRMSMIAIAVYFYASKTT